MHITVVPFAVYDPFFQQVYSGVEGARKELEKNGVEVEWLEEGEAKVERQIELLRGLRERNISGIVICPLDRYRLSDPIKQCVDSGIPVATFCLDAPESGRFFHIGQDLRQSGRLAGYLLGRFICGKGNVGVITGFFDVEGHEERRKGFIETVKGEFEGISISWEEENHDRWEEAYGIVKRKLKENDKIDGLYITAGGPFGAARAIEEFEKSQDISIVCFDFVPETIDFIRRGTIDATIGQDPFSQGYRSVMAVYQYLTLGNWQDREIEYVELEIAVRENVDYLGGRAL